MNPRGRPARRTIGAWRSATALGLVALCAARPAGAEDPVWEPRNNHNLFGMTGLIDMPSAEMQDDGTLSFTAGYHGAGFLRNTLSAQIFPGVEAAFRYSVLDDVLNPDDGETLYDRSFDVKFRLITEGRQRPAVVAGLQDFLGTGVYSGEYVAATKTFFEGDLSVTGGFGWGRFAGRATVPNPLAELSGRFKDRDTDTGLGGEVNFGQFLQGDDIGFFGGLAWRTPVDDLTLKAEFSSDAYPREEATAGYDQSFPVNFGAEYRPTRHLQLGAYYLYGSDFGLRLSISGNPFQPLYRSSIEPGPLPLITRPTPSAAPQTSLLGEIRTGVSDAPVTTSLGEAGVRDVRVETRPGGLRWATATLPPGAERVCPDDAAAAVDAEFGVVDAVTFVHPDGAIVCSVALRPDGAAAIEKALRVNNAWPVAWYDDEAQRAKLVEALDETLDSDRIGLFGIELGPRKVTIYVENRRFKELPRAVGRTARALARILPPSVEVFEIVPVVRSLPVAAIVMERSMLEATVDRPDAAREAWLRTSIEGAEQPDWSEVTGTLDQFPRYSWAIGPDFPISLFDPDQPVRVDVQAVASGSVELRPGLSATGAVRKRVIGQLDDITRKSDSVLPRVRSDFAEYLKEGDPGITRLTSDYVTKFDEDLYGRLSIGYLEDQHAGISGEVLWQPATQSWGLGLELNYSKQREFDMLFGLRDYEVATGHASLYWDTGFEDIFVQLDAGRYLARDWGATFTATRRFANGWQLGGFFTLTDVPFDEFGEGSFDKGLILTIPFNWFAPVETRSNFTYVLRPLTRDGGQRLRVANRLAGVARAGSEPNLREDWGGFWE